MSIKRAVQRDARSRVDAYWAAFHEREEQGAKAVRQRLGLSREALERCAYKHLEDAGHLKHHASKALAMHMADEVWNGVQRHLFPDATGQRFGRPKTGRCHAMAYTDGGQRNVSQPRRMPRPTLPDGKVPTGKLSVAGQPVMRKANWWDHTGSLAVVFSGGPDSKLGDLVLPVRIPQGPGRGRGPSTSSPAPAAGTRSTSSAAARRPLRAAGSTRPT